MAIDKTKFIKVISAYAAKQVNVILRVASETGISPFLIAAIGERESGWGKYLDSNMCGDHGFGHGFLQIDSRSHGEWLNTHKWKDAYINVSFGISLLKQNMAFFQSNGKVNGLTDGKIVIVHRTAALERGVAAGTYKDLRPIINTSDLLKLGVAAYNTGEGNCLISLNVGCDLDLTTADHNYSTDVINNSNSMLAAYNSLAK